MPNVAALAARLAEDVSPQPQNRGTTVFVLGAGFSRAISAVMPLLTELSSAVWTRYEFRDAVPTPLAELLRRDFEEGLSYLVQNKPWLRASEHLRHRALFLDLTYVVAGVLTDAENEAVAAMATETPQWLAALFEYWHRNQSTVITLNYDTLLERVGREFRPLGAPASSNPCVSARIYPPFLTRAATRSQTLPSPDIEPTFELLKLHGSVNWFFSGREAAQGETIYYVEPTGPETSWVREHLTRNAEEFEAVSDKYPMIVPPIFEKTELLTHESIRSIWYRAGMALKRAERVVFLGCSLPPSDRTFRQFLRESLGANAAIEVVVPSDLQQRYLEALTVARNRISQHFTGARCVMDFVESLTPPPTKSPKKSHR